MPWGEIPDEVVEGQVLRVPAVDSRVNSVASRRAAGTLAAQREQQRQQSEAAERAAAEERETQSLRRAHEALTAVKADPLASTEQVDAAAEALGQTIQARDDARTRREQTARADELRREGYQQAVGREIAEAQQQAPLRIQARMEALHLPQAEQEAVWDEIERRSLPMGNLSQVAAAIEDAHSLAYTRYVSRELERQSGPVREQAAKSARAAVHGATQVDPSGGMTGPTQQQIFIQRAMQESDPKKFDEMWRAHKAGKAYVG